VSSCRRLRRACALLGGGEAEEGSATVWVLACALLIVAVAGLLTAVQAAAVARHRAAGAADLAALATAARLAAGAVDGCARGAAVATANRAQLRDCQVLGREVVVTVAVRTGLPGAPAVLALARAGPGAGQP